VFQWARSTDRTRLDGSLGYLTREELDNNFRDQQAALGQVSGSEGDRQFEIGGGEHGANVVVL
jgi:hypothetical protein